MQRFLCISCKLFVILLIGFTADAHAAPAACGASEYRQFDFWLGSWQVEADGKPAGTNQISSEHDGCLLQERWQSVRGNTGSSMNFYDPQTRQWRQIWVSAGTIIDIRGGLEAEGMRLSGTITYLATNQQLPFRGLWTPLADGRVRQYFEERRDGIWHDWFEGFYQKVVE